MAKRWYVVHAYSGYEQQVRRSLEERVQRKGMQDVCELALVVAIPPSLPRRRVLLHAGQFW